jgi:prevent-host-death family protein
MIMPATTTATEIQRNYKKVIKKARKSKQPIVILYKNKPYGVLMDYDTYQKKEQTNGNFNKFRGLWTKAEAKKFNKVVDEMFGKIEPEIWK